MRFTQYAGGRRGVVYVAVLTTSALVATIGLGALLLARIETRRASELDDAQNAHWLAYSAVELGLALIRERPDWRDSFGTGTWINQKKLGDGELWLEVSSTPSLSPGAFSDDYVLRGKGVCGSAVRYVELTLPEGTRMGEWRKGVE